MAHICCQLKLLILIDLAKCSVAWTEELCKFEAKDTRLHILRQPNHNKSTNSVRSTADNSTQNMAGIGNEKRPTIQVSSETAEQHVSGKSIHAAKTF